MARHFNLILETAKKYVPQSPDLPILQIPCFLIEFGHQSIRGDALALVYASYAGLNFYESG